MRLPPTMQTFERWSLQRFVVTSDDRMGRVYDTYAAALQHDLVTLPEGTKRLGVVRRQTPWLAAEIDENEPALGPPAPLLDAVKERDETLRERGLDDVTAHNRAMVDVDYARRYRRHLASSEEAQSAVGTLQDTLRQGTDVALVCYENTDEKRCHRTILREVLVRDR